MGGAPEDRRARLGSDVVSRSPSRARRKPGGAGRVWEVPEGEGGVSPWLRLDPDLSVETFSITAGRLSVVRGTQLSSLITLSLFNVSSVECGRE